MFGQRKVAQMAAFLLDRGKGRMNYLNWIADRAGHEVSLRHTKCLAKRSMN
jgi:hypothetical protein